MNHSPSEWFSGYKQKPPEKGGLKIARCGGSLRIWLFFAVDGFIDRAVDECVGRLPVGGGVCLNASLIAFGDAESDAKSFPVAPYRQGLEAVAA